MRKTLILGLLFTLFVYGCSSTPESEYDETKDWPVEKLYAEAQAEIDRGDYETAIDYLNKVEARFPFGTYALQAQLDTSYAYFLNEEFELAVASADRFIKMNPMHPSVDYAYYLKGLASSSKQDSFIARTFNLDTTKRCQESMQDAFVDFRTLITKFPNSRYAAEARKRMIEIRDDLARQEINIARYYFRRGAMVAALNRAKYVIENYQETPSVYDALIIMAQAYKKLDMNALYDDTIKILRLNYPNQPIS